MFNIDVLFGNLNINILMILITQSIPQPSRDIKYQLFCNFNYLRKIFMQTIKLFSLFWFADNLRLLRFVFTDKHRILFYFLDYIKFHVVFKPLQKLQLSYKEYFYHLYSLKMGVLFCQSYMNKKSFKNDTFHKKTHACLDIVGAIINFHLSFTEKKYFFYIFNKIVDFISC